MAGQPQEANGHYSDPTETSPLLQNKDPSSDHVAVERGPEDDGSQNEANEQSDVAAEPSQTKLTFTLIAPYFGVFLAAMDSTIVATLSGPISNSFNSFTLLSWLASGYLIANAGFQPISGKLTDIYGRRDGLLVSFIFFGLGNLMCGLARSETAIIAGRVVSGIGGGCINTISTFLASDLVPLRKRGVWQGIGNICFGVGAGVGGVFGGWINESLNWRWAFLIQVPLVVVCSLIVFFVVKVPIKESDRSRIKRIDFLGAFTLVTALVLLLLGINSGGNIVPWKHPLVYVSIPLSAVFLVLFVYVEDRVAAEPIIPVRLLLNRTVAAACLTNWFVTMSYFSYLYYGQIFFQVKGASTLEAGIRLLPNALGLAAGSMGSGVLMKATGRYYWMNVGIEATYVLATALMLAFFKLSTPDWPSYIIFFLAGFAYGGMLTVTLLALISAAEHKYQAVITSMSYAFRSTGSAIGIAVASAVFQNLLTRQLWQKLHKVDHATEIIRKVRDSLDEINNLPQRLQIRVLVAYSEALRGVWLIILVLGAAGALASLLMRENKLHSTLDRK